jgi:hypothetical protein
MQNINESIVHCKVFYNNEFRRFPLTKGFSLVDLISKIKTLLNLDTDFTIKYKDEEDDWITISSDVELETGLSLSNSNLFRLTVTVANVSTAIPNPENPSDDALYVPIHRRCKGRKKRWENDDHEDQKETEECGGYRKCGRGRRGGRRGKWRGRDYGTNEDNENGDVGSGSGDLKDQKDQKETEECGGYRKCGRGRRGGKGGRRGWRGRENMDENDEISSGSEEDLKLSLTDINKEISSLTDENALLSENMSNLKDEIASLKGQVRAKRQDENATRDEIAAVRSELQAKKRCIRPLFSQIKSNRFRLRKLRNLASTKSEEGKVQSETA